MTNPASFIALHVAERMTLCIGPPDPLPSSAAVSISTSSPTKVNALASSVSVVPPTEPSGADAARTTRVTDQTCSTTPRARRKVSRRSEVVASSANEATGTDVKRCRRARRVPCMGEVEAARPRSDKWAAIWMSAKSIKSLMNDTAAASKSVRLRSDREVTTYELTIPHSLSQSFANLQ